MTLWICSRRRSYAPRTWATDCCGSAVETEAGAWAGGAGISGERLFFYRSIVDDRLLGYRRCTHRLPTKRRRTGGTAMTKTQPPGDVFNEPGRPRKRLGCEIRLRAAFLLLGLLLLLLHHLLHHLLEVLHPLLHHPLHV